VTTVIDPDVIFEGVVAVINVGELTVNVLGTPLKSTLVTSLKPEPEIETETPAPTVWGEKPLIDGIAGGVITKLPVLTAVPSLVMTVIGPSVAPTGTPAVISVDDVTVMRLLGTPLNCTDCTLLKFVPVITTGVVAEPLAGVKPPIVGAEGEITVKGETVVTAP
jgi:hypothetical protein